MVAHVSECESGEFHEQPLCSRGNYPDDVEFPAVQKTHCKTENRRSKAKFTKLTVKPGSHCSNMAQETEHCPKKKKLKPANYLLCFSIRDPRYDHEEKIKQDGREFISLNQRKISSNICWDEDTELAADIFSLGRAYKDNKPPKLHKQLKEIQFNTKLVKQSKTGNKAIKVKHDIYSRKTQRDDVINAQLEARKANIDKKLKARNLKRRGMKVVTFASTTKQTTSTDRKIRTKRRWTYDRIEERKFMWEVYPYALVEENLEVDKSDPEAQLMWTLMQLQDRDLTPEDYDLLLRLDEKVAAKTVASDKLTTLKTQVLSESDLSTSTIFEDLCMVCMGEYEIEQTVKFLPCMHVFHELCIDNWLTNSGNKCPLDGLEVVL